MESKNNMSNMQTIKFNKIFHDHDQKICIFCQSQSNSRLQQIDICSTCGPQVVHKKCLNNHLSNSKSVQNCVKCNNEVTGIVYIEKKVIDWRRFIMSLHFMLVLISFCWNAYVIHKFFRYKNTTGFKFALAMYIFSCVLVFFKMGIHIFYKNDLIARDGAIKDKYYLCCGPNENSICINMFPFTLSVKEKRSKYISDIIMYYFFSTMWIIANAYLISSYYYTMTVYDLYVYGWIMGISLCVEVIYFAILPLMWLILQSTCISKNVTECVIDESKISSV